MPKARPIKRIQKVPYPYADFADASALKALHAGTATPQQQHIALAWIIKQAAMSKNSAFDPDNARATDFVLGRQFVAHSIVFAIEEPISSFPQQN